MKSPRLAQRNIVLIGVGHTHAHVVRMWRMQAPPNTSLTCISDHGLATYSGMLPAVLAGQLPESAMQIDLVRLCASVGAQLIVDRVRGLDLARKTVLLDDHPPVPYDVLSIGIGSIPSTADVQFDGAAIKIKPMQTFMRRLSARLDAWKQADSQVAGAGRVIRIAVVGGGVAGVEVTCCLTNYLKSHGVENSQLHLITRGDELLSQASPRTRRLVETELRLRGHQVHTGCPVSQVADDGVLLSDGRRIATDLVIWATGANRPPTLDSLGLPQTAAGFLATDNTLRSTSGEPVFAVGDSGSIVDEPLPKAGVYAVRQGPVLWDNLRRTLDGRTLRPFVPQRSFLKLINLGDGRAIAEWKRLSAVGRIPMWIKQRIDGKFMDKHQPQPAMSGSDAMQCRGCGCKLGGATLADVLADRTGDSHSALDDAAAVGPNDGRLMASTDFFSSPFEDGYLAGRVAALHASSDILAMGGQVTQALANVVLPEGDADAQRRLLADFLEGATREFSALGATLVGGHTIVGPRLETGFTVLGGPLGNHWLRKSELRDGDHLVLTKPLGIGVLLVAHMRAECTAREYQLLLDCMLAPQQEFARIASQLDLRAATDVTGFGLAGHLLEMLDASEVGACLDLDAVPVLEGTLAAIERGIESSLIDDNLQAERRVNLPNTELHSHPKFRILFDPQTCGGLLIAVPPERWDDWTQACESAHLATPACIGRVEAAGRADKPLRIS